MTTAPTQIPGERDLLHSAFRSFDQAAQTLQQSYDTLTARVEQMDLELAQSNEALRRQLRENEAMRMHLDGILESLSTGVLVLDDAGVTTRSNAAACELLRVANAELRGRRAIDVLADAGLSVCDRPQRAGQTMLSITSTPLKADSGCHSGSLLLIQDMTRIYQLEEQLQRKDRLAAMGEMIGRIAHEIRNPLGSVELFAPMHDDTIFSLAQALDRVDHDMDIFQTMAELFVEHAPKDLAEARAAVAAQDPVALARAAHRLKGAVLQFCAPAVFEATHKLEEAGKAGDLKSAVGRYVNLETELFRLLAALRHVLEKGLAA